MFYNLIFVNLILRDYTLLNPIYTKNEEVLCAFLQFLFAAIKLRVAP